MKLTLHNTSQIVLLDGVECRVWEGTTEGGVEVTAFVARIAVDAESDGAPFERELRETKAPRPVRAWPSRMVS